MNLNKYKTFNDNNKGLLIVSHENQLDMNLVNFMGKVKIKVREVAAAPR